MDLAKDPGFFPLRAWRLCQSLRTGFCRGGLKWTTKAVWEPDKLSNDARALPCQAIQRGETAPDGLAPSGAHGSKLEM